MIQVYKKVTRVSGPCQPVSGWGGVFQNLVPLPFQGPPKKIFPESKNFSGKCWRRGGGRGGRSTMFFGKQKFPKSFANNIFPQIFKIFSEQILHFLKILQFYYVRAPSPQVAPPLFYFFTPPQVARPCRVCLTNLN